MRALTLAGLAGAALLAAVAPASAAWHGYISHPLGFAFAAPGEMKVEKGTYQAAVGGKHDQIIYKFVDDNIEYKAIVTDVTPIANQSATLLGEGRVHLPGPQEASDGRVRSSRRPLRRKLTIDLPNNGGRTTAAFYFVNGRIVSLQATVLPANGDFGSPEMGRFVDSISFYTVRAANDAIELPMPK
jgi:hypothetical protein